MVGAKVGKIVGAVVGVAVGATVGSIDGRDVGSDAVTASNEVGKRGGDRRAIRDCIPVYPEIRPACSFSLHGNVDQLVSSRCDDIGVHSLAPLVRRGNLILGVFRGRRWRL